MNVITLNDPNNSSNFVRFIFEKSVLENNCNVILQLRDENETIISEKYSIHFSDIMRIPIWYKNMPTGNTEEYSDLIIEDLNLKFSNYYFEKGEGVYYLIYTTEKGKIFKFHFWEQLGISNIIIYNQFMQCLEKTVNN